MLFATYLPMIISYAKIVHFFEYCVVFLVVFLLYIVNIFYMSIHTLIVYFLTLPSSKVQANCKQENHHKKYPMRMCVFVAVFIFHYLYSFL